MRLGFFQSCLIRWVPVRPRNNPGPQKEMRAFSVAKTGVEEENHARGDSAKGRQVLLNVVLGLESKYSDIFWDRHTPRPGAPFMSL